MNSLPHSVQNLITEFSKLPGIGPKTAARLVFYLLSKSDPDVKSLGSAVISLKENLKTCRICFNLSEEDECSICQNIRRNPAVIAVVEAPLDVIAFERTSSFDGVYHVLGGAISPIDGVGPEQLRIEQLIKRVQNNEVSEVILATDPDFEGEATSAYIKEKLSALGSKARITRIARGLPVGSDIEYADEVTIKRSLEGRRDY